MTTTLTDDLTARIQAALRDDDVPLWFPDLTPALVDAGWHKLGRDLRLTRASYGTARALRRNPEEARCLVTSVDTPSADGVGHGRISIELLPGDIAQKWARPQSRFFGADEILGDSVSGQVREALEVLGCVPTVLTTVCTLIKSLHLIDLTDDQLDVSFSDPELPFSAFVSVPGQRALVGGLRIAEALLHEAMHLQLTLAESVVPLVEPSDGTYFSPWRNEQRTPLGILHALYVFSVIHAFFDAIHFDGPASVSLWRHAHKRMTAITHQIGAIHDFHECPSLTEAGSAFVGRMLG